jgi:hypothetical protein
VKVDPDASGIFRAVAHGGGVKLAGLDEVPDRGFTHAQVASSLFDRQQSLDHTHDKSLLSPYTIVVGLSSHIISDRCRALSRGAAWRCARLL